MTAGKGEPKALAGDGEAALWRRVAELEAEAQRFRATLYSIGDGVIATDAIGNILQMNHVAEALTGWPEVEAKGRPIAEVFTIINEESRAEVENPVERVLREGVVVGLANHTLLIAKDGKAWPIADSGAPIRDEKGEVTGVVLVFRDQTEERAAQKALTESERKFHDTIENLDDGYYSVTMGGILLDHNPAFNRVLGIDSERDMKGVPSPDFWQRPEDRSAYVAELTRNGVVTNFEVHARKTNGEKIFVLLSAHVVRDGRGEPQRIDGTVRDITDRRQAEEKYRSLFDNAQVGMYRSRLDGSGFVALNQRLADMFGYTKEEMLSSPATIRWAHPAARTEMVRLLRERGELRDHEIDIVTKCGEIRTTLASITLFPDGGFLEGSVVDITERKRMEEALLRTLDQLGYAQRAARGGFWDWDMKTGRLHWTTEFFDLFGIASTDSPTFDLWTAAVHPDDREPAMATINRSIAERTPLDSQYRIVLPGGEVRWIHALGNTSRDNADEPIQMTGLCVDITARKQAEEALRESERRFRDLFNNSLSGIALHEIVVNAQGEPIDYIFLEANPAFETQTGTRVADILGHRATEVYPGIEKSGLIKIYGRAALGVEPVIFETFFEPLQRHYHISAFQAGQGRFAAVFDDITQRKTHEREIEQVNLLYATLSQINQAIVRVKSHEELTREVTRVVVEFGGFKLAWVGEHDPRTREVTLLGFAGEPGAFVHDDRHSSDEGAEHRCLCGRAIRENRSCVVNDLPADPETDDWHSAMKQAGIRAAGVFPVRVRGAVWGVLGVYSGESGVFQDKETALLEEAAMDIGYAIEHIESETQRRQAEKLRLLSTAILGILNEPLTLQEASNAILGLIKKETGLDAVGIRLSHGDDFPYFSQDGFDKDFLLAENSVILRSETGSVCRDADGRPCLECTCGMVLSGKCGPASDHVTPAGSIWTNDSLALAESLHGDDPRLRPRDRCVHEGFLSVALIPIRAGERMIGLLHLNDRRKDRFTPETIRFFEGLTATLGIAVERKRAEERLKASEEYLERIINAIGDPVFVKDEQFRFTLVNDALCTLLGKPRNEIVGTTGLEFLPPDQMDHFLEVDRKVLSSGAEDLCKEPLTAHDGKVRTVVTRKTRYVDGRGAKFVVGTIRDVTEHEQLEEQLRTSQKIEAIGSLAGGVAHDFNNILSVILSYTGYATEALREGDPLRSDLVEVKRAGERAAALTRQLLAFSRKQILQPVSLSLNQIAAGVERMLRRIVGEDIDYVQVLATDLGVVRADPGQIEQVLMNLAVNARDAMPEGGKLTIETANVEIDEEYAACHVAVTPGSYVQLAVTDTGCGMDEQTKARLFEPFFTTKEKGKGTGLGLSTVYGIVKQSGGNIWVYSEPGRGTTFKIYLPRELGATPTTVTQAPGVATRVTGTETVLVVEDEEALRKVARRSLTSAGFTVLTAANGVEAIEVAARHAGEIQLLLTDVVMPKMSGRALAQELVKTRPAIRVLYMSGYTDNAIVHHGVLDTGTQFIGKPFTGTDLARKVREVLDGVAANPVGGHARAVEAGAELEEQPVDRAALRALSADVFLRLRKAVIAARHGEIVEIVESIRGTAPEVAARLRRMADLFDYKGLRALLEP
jgi:PAS domain S-box-containing protein